LELRLKYRFTSVAFNKKNTQIIGYNHCTLLRRGWAIPRRVYWEIQKLNRFIKQYHSTHHQYPTITQINTALNWKIAKIQDIIYIGKNLLFCMSLDEIIKHHPSSIPACNYQTNIDNDREIGDFKKALFMHIDGLPTRYKDVINVKYRISTKSISYTKCGKILNLSRQRICQIEQSAR
jgi:DNA-directed RNA polymerase specialized sigma subunit